MTTQALPRATVLIVEDDPWAADLEKGRLEEAGYRADIAATPDAALRALGGKGVDLLLLDYRLPGGTDGLDVYDRVKAAGYDVPVILVTAFGNEATAIRALRAGVRDFVSKSAEYLDYLPEAVARVLRQVETERRLAESEARLAAVVGSAKDAVIVAEADRRIVLFNPAAERMFRCPAAAAAGRPVTDFIPDEPVSPPDGPDTPSLSQRLRAGTRGVRADGEVFPLEASVSRARANGRGLYGVVVRDVTERVRAEAALRESEERFRAFMDNSSLAAWMKDEDGRYVYLSRPYQRRFRVRLEDWLGKTDADVWPPDIAAQFRANDRLVLREGRPVETAETTPNPDGTRAYWWSCKFPFRDAAGRRYVGGISFDITDRMRAEERVREQANLLDRAHDAIQVEGLDGRVRYWNRGAERVYGWAAAEVVGREAGPLLWGGHEGDRREALGRVFADGEWAGELRQVTRAGKEIVTRGSWSLLRTAAGEPAGVLMIGTDVTDRKRLEQQLRQAQKMEVVGQLAGGIAHDFNNLLTVINGYGDLALGRLPPGDPVRGMVEEVRRSGDRAAELTRQLLAFSRKQVLEPKVFDLNEAVRGADRMLRRLIGEDVDLAFVPAPAPVRVKTDPGQLEQVILNLAVNARDAMPTGGKLTVETAEVELDEAYARTRPDVRPGRYALLGVSDTGHGMDEATRARVFEPFFTTKVAGKGTGLGLSTVWGIVTQSGGHVEAYSEPGRGTVFKVYLPVTGEAADGGKPQSVSREGRRGSETVLLVEDEPAVRQLTRLALTQAGYRVLEADRPEAAVALARAHAGPVHLLVTDVVMPGMGVRQLAEEVTRLRPGVRVLYLSGYTPDAVVRHGVLQADVAFLQKPFAVRALTQKVRDVLDQ